MLTRSILLVLLAAASHGIPSKRNADSIADNSRVEIEYRLPDTVIPSHYNLSLEPNFVDFNFKGETIINITVKADVDEIKIHAQNLTFVEEETQLLNEKGEKVITTISPTFFEETDFYVLGFTPKIKAGTYQLKFKYSGILHDDMYGFYRSSYVNERGDTVWLATTQFEPTFARRAFPCFDEPALKATFKVKIRHFDNYTAISNMHAQSQTRPNNDLIRWDTEFAETPLMSTYLVAFVVSDFKYLSSKDGKFRVLSRSNQIHNGEYAQDVGKKELDVLVNYLGSSHGMSKMDNIAIPQFAAGAMENWGLVTYRESALLYEENVTTSASKQSIAGVISHEFAHQWFGNRVSPLWWDYTWLNEGFANYFQFFITDKVETDWRFMDQFVIKTLQRTAFIADDNVTQHAMDTTVKNTPQIRANFDAITYSKAGSVIRMFSHMITEPQFQAALRQYLEANKFKATKSDDLIKSLTAAVPADSIYKQVNMTSVFEEWIRTPGFPVITVKRNYTTKTATITQKRFLTNATSPPTELWTIPTNYATEDNPNFSKTAPTLWIPKKSESVDIVNGLPEKKWVIFNVQQTGYYRVNYDTDNWKLIAEYLKDPKKMENINVLNRAQLLDDSFYLVQVGELPDYSVFLAISEHLQNEVDYVPWYAARNAFTKMKNTFVRTESFNLFKLYMLKLVEKVEKSLGYGENSTDNILHKMNRIDTIGLACEMGSKDCLTSTHTQLLGYVDGSKTISSDLRTVVLCSGIRSANATTWQKVYDFAARKNNKSQEYNSLASALGCSSNKDMISKYLENSLLIESQFSWTTAVDAVVEGSPLGVELAFEFIKKNMEKIIETNPELKPISVRVVKIAKAMTSKSQLTMLKEWIDSLTEKHKEFAADLTKTALVETAKNVEWISQHEPKISEFLESQKLIVPEESKGGPGFASISHPSIPLLVSTIIAAAWRRV